MRIIYIAKFGQQSSNDDEGAITHALTSLGHTVCPVLENKAYHAHRVKADLVLFHKFDDVEILRQFEGKAKRVFYYFDLVTYPDVTLAGRNATRVSWMNRITPHVDLGFCTDGTWVDADRTGKLVWLPQGADERVTGVGKAGTCPTCEQDWPGIPILFTGIRNGGTQRQSFVDELATRYGPRFRHVPSGIHGRKLADLIAGSHVVVAPDGPVTDRYTSNRAYLMLGFGAFLLHPWCKALADHYRDGSEIVYYQDRPDLHAAIEYYLGKPAERQRIAAAGLQRTLAEHTYRHRCEQLIRTVQERLL